MFLEALFVSEISFSITTLVFIYDYIMLLQKMDFINASIVYKIYLCLIILFLCLVSNNINKIIA